MFDGGKVTEFEQNGNTFYVRPMDPFTSLKLLGDLQRLVSPVIGNVFSAFNTGKHGEETAEGETGAEGEEAEKISILDNDIDMSAIEKAFSALAQHVDGQKLEAMSVRILDKDYVSVSIDGSGAVRLGKAQINELFTGNISGMLTLIVEILKVNYGDFTELFKSLSGNVVALKSKK